MTWHEAEISGAFRVFPKFLKRPGASIVLELSFVIYHLQLQPFGYKSAQIQVPKSEMTGSKQKELLSKPLPTETSSAGPPTAMQMKTNKTSKTNFPTLVWLLISLDAIAHKDPCERMVRLHTAHPRPSDTDCFGV